jgi:hypothetical protein
VPDQSPFEPLRAHAWVVPDAVDGLRRAPDVGVPAAGALEPVAEVAADDATAEGAAEETAEEFARRVQARVQVARYGHSMKRVVHSPSELAAIREIEQQARVWVPVITFAVTAVCAVVVVFLATTTAGDPGHGRGSDALVALATVGFLVAGFLTLTRSQDYFDVRRPGGRVVRTDLADAYETVRDGAAVLVELGVPPAALTRVADLLPQAELILDFLVRYDAAGGVVRSHPAYEQLILMGAEVTVLTDMAEERMCRRSTRRRDRPTDDGRDERPVDEPVSPFDTLADLVAMLGPDLPDRPQPPATPYR